MAPLTTQQTRFAGFSPNTARLGILALLAITLSVFGAVHAQAPVAEKINYYPAATFFIPFDTNDNRITRVHLYVTEDRGKTYQRAASALPSDRGFKYTATRDGLYGFITQTEDRDGLHPANVTQMAPALQMCIDTIKPVVSLKQVQSSREGMIAVEWDVRDDNLDLMSLRLDYRPAGAQNWTAIPIDLRAVGSREWNPGAGGQFDVRMYVADLAKNQGEQTIAIGGGARPAPATGPIPAPGNSGVGLGQIQPQPNEQVKWVNTKSFLLNYTLDEVGESGAPKVEVWVCTPTAPYEWKLQDTVEAKRPIQINTPGEARYGYTIIPISGVDLAAPRPLKGDAPQIWVEVDMTRPVVHLDRVDVGRGADRGNVTVYWDASDNRELAANPITISYSQNPPTKENLKGGPWTVIASQLPNTRSYVWKHDGTKVPWQIYLKVEATDKAGNVGEYVRPDPVKVDLKIPKASIKDIQPVVDPAKP